MADLDMALTRTAELYGVKLSKDRLNGYLAALSSYQPERVISVLADMIKDSEWFPKPAEIIQRLRTKATYEDPQLPEADVSVRDQAFGLEMFMLMRELLARKVNREEYEKAMLDLARKHGVEAKVRDAMERV